VTPRVQCYIENASLLFQPSQKSNRSDYTYHFSADMRASFSMLHHGRFEVNVSQLSRYWNDALRKHVLLESGTILYSWRRPSPEAFWVVVIFDGGIAR